MCGADDPAQVPRSLACRMTCPEMRGVRPDGPLINIDDTLGGDRTRLPTFVGEIKGLRQGQCDAVAERTYDTARLPPLPGNNYDHRRARIVRPRGRNTEAGASASRDGGCSSTSQTILYYQQQDAAHAAAYFRSTARKTTSVVRWKRKNCIAQPQADLI